MKGTWTFTVVVFFFLNSSLAAPSLLIDMYDKELRGSVTGQKLTAIQIVYELRMKTVRFCKAELAAGIFPENCLATIDSETLNIVQKESGAQWWNQINHLCVDQAKHVEHTNILKEIVSREIIGEPCAQALRTQIRVLNYRAGQ